ncbi:hypothetical protein OROHE_000530 [Orobanche hederae]
MSGGVGPPCDITLPKDEPHEPYTPKPTSTVGTGRKPPHASHSFLAFRQLCPRRRRRPLRQQHGHRLGHHLAFPPSRDGQSDLRVIQNPLLSTYTAIGSVVGLFIPIAYIYKGVYKGDEQGIKAATAHVFLLDSQVFMEGVAISARFSVPVWVIVPVVFNTMRILSIMEWVQNEISKVDVGYGGNFRKNKRWGSYWICATIKFIGKYGRENEWCITECDTCRKGVHDLDPGYYCLECDKEICATSKSVRFHCKCRGHNVGKAMCGSDW